MPWENSEYWTGHRGQLSCSMQCWCHRGRDGLKQGILWMGHIHGAQNWTQEGDHSGTRAGIQSTYRDTSRDWSQEASRAGGIGQCVEENSLCRQEALAGGILCWTGDGEVVEAMANGNTIVPLASLLDVSFSFHQTKLSSHCTRAYFPFYQHHQFVYIKKLSLNTIQKWTNVPFKSSSFSSRFPPENEYQNLGLPNSWPCSHIYDHFKNLTFFLPWQLVLQGCYGGKKIIQSVANQLQLTRGRELQGGHLHDFYKATRLSRPDDIAKHYEFEELLKVINVPKKYIECVKGFTHFMSYNYSYYFWTMSSLWIGLRGIRLMRWWSAEAW